MKPLGHAMILASAGSGKTYALTNRFVRLLAGGVAPDRIAALTFTRKAAGEFFDEILKKLAGAASDPAQAAQLAREIDLPGMGPADFNRLLRQMIEAMPRLNLGTLDGFFARIVRAFPLELGLSGEFAILEEHSARLARREVLRRLFAGAGGDSETARQDFIESFKRATFGVEEKRLLAQLDSFLDQHADIFLDAPDESLWGRAERIWPGGSPWLAAGGSRSDAAATLQAALADEALAAKPRQHWDDFFVALPGWAPGAALPKPVAYILEKALEAWPQLIELRMHGKGHPLPRAAADQLRRVVTSLVGAELTRRLEMTRGIFDLLRRYEAVYDGTVRRSGRLTFADLQRLLRPERGGRSLSRTERDEARLFIDWRLDARIDHWLLDEFQDTSPGQWSVLRNLIDEAVQDPEGGRSLFYVGDVKQSIFAWRAGDPRLFREIFQRYNGAAGDVIAEHYLVRSYRSGPAVIDTVNRVFGDAEAFRRLLPVAAAERWRKEWRTHESAKPDLASYAELRSAPDETGRFAAALQILRETGALDRGWETAVLVRTNAVATDLADYLRREGGLPAVAESDLHIGLDNPLTCALLALFRAAAHPGDRAAWLQVEMTPLLAVLEEEGMADPNRLTLRLLGEIHHGGFGASCEAWLRRLDSRLAAGDHFSRERGRQFAAAAREFDELGNGEVAEFVAFMERYTLRDPEAAGVVRVMTVHKAKGLGFDLVILPDLEGRTVTERQRGLAVSRGPDRAVQWILNLPGSEFRAADPVLSALVAGEEEDACYENLCVLYVAMTRAKRAMYLVTEPKEKSSSINFPRLLRETLGGSWTRGDPRWFEAEGAAAPAALPPPLARLPPAPGRPPRLVPRRPSAEGARAESAARLFDPGAAAGQAFGSAVHGLFSGIEWLDTKEAAAMASAWSGRGEAAAAAGACLLAPDLAGLWRRPAGGASKLWRERAFEVVLDKEWVTGTCDRVVVRCNSAGAPVAATVYDFKTDQLPAGADLAAEAARYRGQIDLYRRAVAVLAGLAVEKVAAEIVFVRALRRVAIR